MRDRQRPSRIHETVASFCLLLLAGTVAGLPPPSHRGRAIRRAATAIGFLENLGQTDSRVAYYFATAGEATFVTHDGRIVHSVRTGTGTDKSRTAIAETLLGSRPHPLGQKRSSARASVLRGAEASRWRSDIPVYEIVSLGEVWPGVHVRLRGDAGGVERLFALRAGAPPDAIRVRVSGADSLRVSRDGRLIARAGDAELAWSAPVAYQEIDGGRRPVAASYEVRGAEYGFRLGPRDPSLAVTIDPVLQATYLGGSGNDYAFAVAIRPDTGEVLVAGRTESPDFPGVTGGPQNRYAGGSDDVFVARLTPDLQRLEQATYFGGSGTDLAFAIAIHPATREVYIAGQTCSPDLPGTSDAAQPRYAGNCDAFVARFDPKLARVERVSYVGGSWGDGAYGIAISLDGTEVYVAGYTASPDFPAARGGARESRNPALGYDAFVARLDSSLRFLRQSTYLGGDGGLDVGTAVAVDPWTGEVVVGGQTDSVDFPGTAGGAEPQPRGAYSDGFVARLDPTLTLLRQSTYLGGGLYTNVIAVAIHPRTGEVFAAGQTSSPDLPGTAAGGQPDYGGAFDGFVARLDPGLTVVRSATFFGGSRIELAHALAIHPRTGDVYVGGETNSRDLPGAFEGAQPGFGGGFTDGFVARFDESLSRLERSTYLGGSDIDRVYALAVSPSTGELLVAGETRSSPFPATEGGAQPRFGGGDLYGGDAFVARLAPDLGAAGVPGTRVRPVRSGEKHPRVVTFD